MITVSLIIAVLLLLFLFNCFTITPTGHSAVTLWFGRPHRILTPGLWFLLWPFETIHRVKWSRTEETKDGNGEKRVYNIKFVPTTENIYDPPPYCITTQDKLEAEINIVVFYRINDVHTATTAVEDLYQSMEQVINTTVFQSTSGMPLDMIMENKDKLSSDILEQFEHYINDWGVRITRVDVQNIKPPKSIVKTTISLVKNKRIQAAKISERKVEHAARIDQIEKETEETMKQMELEEEKLRREYEMRKLKAEYKRNIREIQLQAVEKENTINTEAKANILKVYENSNIGEELIRDMIKWENLPNMTGVKYIPNEALGLLGSAKLYRNLQE